MVSDLMRVQARVDLDAVCANIGAVQKKVGGNVAVTAVIKTNAYGHGAVEVAKALVRRNNIYGFAVATVPEAVELRKNEIQNPILILGYSFDSQFDDIIKYDITQTVFQFDYAQRLSQAAAAAGKKVKVHIKIDTGMGRIGFIPNEESLNDIVKICALPNLFAQGIFTHFACADEKDKTSANRQKDIFVSFIDKLKSRNINIPVVHACNSASVMDFDDRYFNMVRSGIMTYGLTPSADVKQDVIKLHPAMSIISHVSFVKTIHKGDTVSYGSTYVAPGDRVIATVPVGYGDGYPRKLSNAGHVLVGGEFAPIVGRVCMDQFMIDVTDIPAVKQGDEVVIIGEMNGKKISVEEVADSVGSFNYEFVCDINRRVPRVYIEDGKTVKIIDYLEL